MNAKTPLFFCYMHSGYLDGYSFDCLFCKKNLDINELGDCSTFEKDPGRK